MSTDYSNEPTFGGMNDAEAIATFVRAARLSDDAEVADAQAADFRRTFAELDRATRMLPAMAPSSGSSDYRKGYAEALAEAQDVYRRLLSPVLVSLAAEALAETVDFYGQADDSPSNGKASTNG